MQIYLIRHGITEANERRLYCGSSDVPLCANGVEQLGRLKREIIYPTVKTHITSNMQRAIQTLKILYDKSPDLVIDAFNEYDFGEFEMKSHEELQDVADYQRWIEKIGENDDFACPGGESTRDFKNRVISGLETVCEMNVESVVMVCHGGTISALMEHLFPERFRNRYEWLPMQGRGYAVEINDKQKTLKII